MLVTWAVTVCRACSEVPVDQYVSGSGIIFNSYEMFIYQKCWENEMQRAVSGVCGVLKSISDLR